MNTPNVEQFNGENNAQYIERLRSQLRQQKELETNELTMKRYLEDSLSVMRATGASLNARIELQRQLALCCHRMGVARGTQDILTARLVTALNW